MADPADPDVTVIRPEAVGGYTLIPYDLGAGMFCEECGRAKINRLLMGAYVPLRNAFRGGSTRGEPAPSTGCATCDQAIETALTRCRCPGLPDISTLRDGDQWTCPSCAAVWAARVEAVVSEERAWQVTRPDSEEPPA